MTETTLLSKTDCKKLSLKIKEDVFKPVHTFKTTVFFCGADINQTDKLRSKITVSLKDKWYSYLYDIIYPEDIFDELLYSSQSKDLLSLENLLAESIDAIIIIPESPGSFAELGAFTNDEKLRPKIICIIDKKYKKDRSFINQGPVKLIKKANKNGLLFIDPLNIDDAVDKLRSLLHKIKKSSRKLKDKINLLQLDNYLLPSIYLLEPVTKETLKELVAVATEDEPNAFQLTTTALTILTNKRQVELTTEGYKLTQMGLRDFFSLRQNLTRVKYQDETVALDNLRLEILNLKLRNKKLRI